MTTALEEKTHKRENSIGTKLIRGEQATEETESQIDLIMDNAKLEIMRLGFPCWIEKTLDKTKLIYHIQFETWIRSDHAPTG